MAMSKPSGQQPNTQPAGPQLADIIDAVNPTNVLRRLNHYRLGGGRRTYELVSFWRAYLASFVLNLSSTNELIRRLRNDPALRLLCGFSSTLPHRTTFNRFITRLSRHHDLVEEAIAPLTDDLREMLPDLGQKVAVDSTDIHSHSNPNGKLKSDPEANWGVKNKARAKDGTEWFWGYKLHFAVDAVHQVPLGGYVTPGNSHDSPHLPRILDAVQDRHPWVGLDYVMADKGYDSQKNHRDVLGRDGAFICPLRSKLRSSDGGLYDDIFTKDGTPTCVGMAPMDYVRSDPQKGHLYRCPNVGCNLKNRKGVVYCQDEFWVNPDEQDNPRLHGPGRRDSARWKQLYRLRYSVERVFKSMKESRRLDSHFIRGLARVALHAVMSWMAYTATMLVRMLYDEADVRWMVDRVA